MALALVFALSVLLPAGQAWSSNGSIDEDAGMGKGKKIGQLDTRPPGWQKGKKQGWRGEFPPGWKNWDGAKRQGWQQGLGRAKDAVRKHTEARLDAALRALEMAARKGLPLEHAEQMAKTGLERGLGPFDFEPLGKFVVERVRQGVKGEDLAETIHEEINRRRQERERLREQMKELKSQREKQDSKRDLEKRQKERQLEKRAEEEKGKGKHSRPHPKAGRGRGKRGR